MSSISSNGATLSTFEHRSSISIDSEIFVIGSALSSSELPEEVSVDAKERSARKVNKRLFGDTQKKEERMTLSRHAKTVLLDWYNAHISNPYARHAEMVVLAQAAGIETGQARRWLANKRTRSGNTFPTNELMKLREATKLQEIQKIRRSVVELPKCSKSKKSKKAMDVKPLNTVVTAGLSQPPDWGHYSGNVSLAQPQSKSQFSAKDLPSLPFFSFGGTNVGPNPWMHAPGAAVPIINPYTGQSLISNGASGMPFPFPAMVPFFPAMVPFFPWQFPNATLPVFPLPASGASDVNVASRRIQSSTEPVPREARDIGENAMLSPSSFVNGPQFALPSFADYLALQRSMPEGIFTASADPVILKRRNNCDK